MMRALPYIAGLAALIGLFALGWQMGSDSTEEDWQLKWSQQQTKHATALAEAQQQARDTEQRWQAKINEVQSNAQDEINQARADAVAADVAADSLREQIDRLGEIASQPACNTSPANGGKAAKPAGMVLADVLKRVEQRGRELAAAYDHSRLAGLACEQSYNAIAGGK